jgi:hypothetical protein
MQEKFANYIYAFFSLAFIEKENCQFSEENLSLICSMSEKKGWMPEDYFRLHLNLLDYATDELLEGTKLHLFFNLQTEISEQLLQYAKMRRNGTAASLLAIKNRIQQIGSYTLYPWGPEDNPVYLDILHKSKDKYCLTIFDVGASHTNEPSIRPNYKPITYQNLSREKLFLHLNRLLSMQKYSLLSKEDYAEKFHEYFQSYQ